MTEETNRKESDSSQKLLIDDPSDFRLHAAYLAYSEAFDKNTDLKIRNDLNQSIAALKKSKIDYPTFYRNIGMYRSEGQTNHDRGGLFLKTQRKKDWRRATQKSERIRRHKK